jgi:hypothetical protein
MRIRVMLVAEVDDGAGLADVVHHLVGTPARIVFLRAEQALRPADAREAESLEAERAVG